MYVDKYQESLVSHVSIKFIQIVYIVYVKNGKKVFGLKVGISADLSVNLEKVKWRDEARVLLPLNTMSPFQ